MTTATQIFYTIYSSQAICIHNSQREIANQPHKDHKFKQMKKSARISKQLANQLESINKD